MTGRESRRPGSDGGESQTLFLLNRSGRVVLVWESTFLAEAASNTGRGVGGAQLRVVRELVGKGKGSYVFARLVRHPGTPGQVHSELVSNVDIAPTVAALTGASPTIRQDGVSLVPLLTGVSVPSWRTGLLQHWPGGDENGTSVNRPVPASYGIRTRDFRYFELSTGERELYDLRTDPYELQNVAGRAAYATIQADLRTQLAALKAQSPG